MKIQLCTTDLLDVVSNGAKASPRLRMNHNFHNGNDDLCHRMFNAVEPGTYVPPHCHEDKDESMIMVRGKMGLVIFSAEGKVDSHCILEAGSECFGVDIPRGVFHSLVSFESGSVFFESKEGPYRPLNENEKAGFAPEADSAEAVKFLNSMTALFEI